MVAHLVGELDSQGVGLHSMVREKSGHFSMSQKAKILWIDTERYS